VVRPPTALDGVLVADFSRVLAGPLATMILGDLGADVVKVENPDGGDDTRAWGPPWSPDGDSSYYLGLNRNKRSVTLDLKDPTDLGAAMDLALRADVVIENFRPGVMRRFGLDEPSVRASNPAVVYCSILGIGRGDVAGYDFLAQAVGGLMSVTGDPEGEPRKVGVALVDVMAGLHAAIGIVAALRHRERTGEGQLVEVDLLSTTLFSLVNQASGYLTAGVVPHRMGNRHPSIAPYETFAASDGPIVIAVGNDGQFRTLCRSLGDESLADEPSFATNGDRVTNRDALVGALEARLRSASAASWVDRLRRDGIPCGVVHDVAEAFAYARTVGLDPVANPLRRAATTIRYDPPLPRRDGIEVDTVANPLRLSLTPIRYDLPPPTLGEHTGEVLGSAREKGVPRGTITGEAGTGASGNTKEEE
jgi:crotonobetainyl-CoA:carnitine CoA-transferase CaiB-like acyl-CoA transferase